jgi:hypothetical protein
VVSVNLHLACVLTFLVGAEQGAAATSKDKLKVQRVESMAERPTRPESKDRKKTFRKGTHSTEASDSEAMEKRSSLVRISLWCNVRLSCYQSIELINVIN